MVSLCVAAAAIIGEIIWEKCDRKKFSTMLICYTILMVGWYVGAFAPLILLKDMYIASLPTMAEFNTQVFNLVAGPLFLSHWLKQRLEALLALSLEKQS